MNHHENSYDYYHELESHNLTTEELEALWPYVVMATEYSWWKVLLVMILYVIVGIPILFLLALFTLGGIHRIFQSETLTILLTISFIPTIVIAVALVPVAAGYDEYKTYHWINDIREKFKSNPRAILDDPTNRERLNPEMIENTDGVYPPEARVNIDKEEIVEGISERTIRDALSDLITAIRS